MTEYWSWILGFIGIAGFILTGRKIWWAWYVNIGAQVVWFTYAIVTVQYGFLVSSIVYAAVFSYNAYLWTKDRKLTEQAKNEQIQKLLADVHKQLIDPNILRKEYGYPPKTKDDEDDYL